jgi:hypothetical protein
MHLDTGCGGRGPSEGKRREALPPDPPSDPLLSPDHRASTLRPNPPSEAGARAQQSSGPCPRARAAAGTILSHMSRLQGVWGVCPAPWQPRRGSGDADRPLFCSRIQED